MTNTDEALYEIKRMTSMVLRFIHREALQITEFELSQLKSILTPISKEDAIILSKDATRDVNYACIITAENEKDLLSWNRFSDYNIWDIVWFNKEWIPFNISDEEIMESIFFYVK